MRIRSIRLAQLRHVLKCNSRKPLRLLLWRRVIISRRMRRSTKRAAWWRMQTYHWLSQGVEAVPFLFHLGILWWRIKCMKPWINIRTRPKTEIMRTYNTLSAQRTTHITNWICQTASQTSQSTSLARSRIHLIRLIHRRSRWQCLLLLQTCKAAWSTSSPNPASTLHQGTPSHPYHPRRSSQPISRHKSTASRKEILTW